MKHRALKGDAKPSLWKVEFWDSYKKYWTCMSHHDIFPSLEEAMRFVRNGKADDLRDFESTTPYRILEYSLARTIIV